MSPRIDTPAETSWPLSPSPSQPPEPGGVNFNPGV